MTAAAERASPGGLDLASIWADEVYVVVASSAPSVMEWGRGEQGKLLAAGGAGGGCRRRGRGRRREANPSRLVPLGTEKKREAREEERERKRKGKGSAARWHFAVNTASNRGRPKNDSFH